MWRLAFTVVFATLLTSCSVGSRTHQVIEVPGDYPTLSAAILEALDGATITLAPGRYVEQVVIDRPLSIVVGEPGSAQIGGVRGGAVISIRGTTDVTIRGLTIVGGDIGISVMQSADITIADNVITGSSHRGIDVVYGAATVTGNRIQPAPGPYVIGIRVANASSWPESVISDNVIDHAGGYGIAVNFANVTVDGNNVVGGDQAGIAINEMSNARVFGNAISEASRYGILVHDMSHAVVTENVISGSDEPIKLTYHSTVELSGNETD